MLVTDSHLLSSSTSHMDTSIVIPGVASFAAAAMRSHSRRAATLLLPTAVRSCFSSSGRMTSSSHVRPRASHVTSHEAESAPQYQLNDGGGGGGGE